MKYYIAYGSNMSIDQMQHRCPDARPLGVGVLKGWRLVFRLHATIEPKKGHEVPVIVWGLSDKDEKSLDHYEGFPIYYRKQFLPVKMKPLVAGLPTQVMGMAYIMNDIDTHYYPPTKDYYFGIKNAYDFFGIDTGTLEAARVHADNRRKQREKKGR